MAMKNCVREATATGSAICAQSVRGLRAPIIEVLMAAETGDWSDRR
jgi:hypothetical protein